MSTRLRGGRRATSHFLTFGYSTSGASFGSAKIEPLMFKPDKSVRPTGSCLHRDTQSHKIMEGISEDLLVRRHHLPHWQAGGRTYFVTFRSARGVLPDKALSQVTENIRYDHRRRYQLELAVVMPDHVHLLFTPLLKSPNVWHDLAEIMKGIKGVSARRINQLLETKGTVWQDESFDRIMRDETEFRATWNYMINNPVKAGLVSQPEDYKFFVFAE